MHFTSTQHKMVFVSRSVVILEEDFALGLTKKDKVIA